MLPFVGMGGLQCTCTVALSIASTITFLGEDGATNTDTICNQFGNRKPGQMSSHFSDIS